MRPVYAVLVWVVILGGLWVYTEARDYFDRPSSNAEPILPAPGKYELELTPTFDAITSVDEFSVDLTPRPTLLATLNGREIIRFTDKAPAGVAKTFSWDTNKVPMNIGPNGVYLELAAPPAEAEVRRGVRVQVLRDGESIADQMLWSQPGGPVLGRIVLDVPEKPGAKDEEHAH